MPVSVMPYRSSSLLPASRGGRGVGEWTSCRCRSGCCRPTERVFIGSHGARREGQLAGSEFELRSRRQKPVGTSHLPDARVPKRTRPATCLRRLPDSSSQRCMMGPGHAALPLTVSRSCKRQAPQARAGGDGRRGQRDRCAASHPMPARRVSMAVGRLHGWPVPVQPAPDGSHTCCRRLEPRPRAACSSAWPFPCPHPRHQPSRTLRAAAAAAACCCESMCMSRQVSRWEYMVGTPMNTVTGSASRCGVWRARGSG